MNSLDFGHKLKLKRIELHLKSKEVASKLNVSPSVISNLENKRRSDHIIVKYLKYLCSLGVDINNFFKSKSDE